MHILTLCPIRCDPSLLYSFSFIFHAFWSLLNRTMLTHSQMHALPLLSHSHSHSLWKLSVSFPFSVYDTFDVFIMCISFSHSPCLPWQDRTESYEGVTPTCMGHKLDGATWGGELHWPHCIMSVISEDRYGAHLWNVTTGFGQGAMRLHSWLSDWCTTCHV